jgi:hypothetical protein
LWVYSGEPQRTLFFPEPLTGVAQSLFAIWLAWLMPTAILPQPALPDIKNLKSRTQPPRRPTLPLDRNLAPILAENPGNQPPRRVYFADAPSDATITTQTTVTVPPVQATDSQSTTSSQTTEASHQLSMHSPEIAAGPFESLDSLVLDSDSSSRPSSLKRSSRLTKFKLGFRSPSLDVAANHSNDGSFSCHGIINS